MNTLTDLLKRSIADAESVRALARASGVNHATLFDFVNGKHGLSLANTEKLIKHLGIESRATRRKGEP